MRVFGAESTAGINVFLLVRGEISVEADDGMPLYLKVYMPPDSRKYPHRVSDSWWRIHQGAGTCRKLT